MRDIYTILLTFLLGVAWGFGFHYLITSTVIVNKEIYDDLYTIHK
nr:MAG TPA: Protein of unknown function (DUF1043) [Bacteriophage sp.]